MKSRKFTALLLSGVLAASMLAGCGGVNKEETVAVLDGQNIQLGIANFAARLQQAGYDDFYVAYFGEEVWSSDLYGNGTTMEAQIKDGVIESMKDMYTLKNHMDDYGISLSEDEKTAISDTAVSFMDANAADAIDALGATREIVEEYLTLVTIQNKMHEAIIADADTDVSDEEANTSAYSYVRISKTSYTDADGNVVEYTEEELTDLLDTVEKFALEAQSDQGMEAAAENYEYTVNPGTFTAGDETLDAAVLSSLQGLKEGEVSGVIDTDSNYYVLRLDAKTDEEATESNRQSIISERQEALYEEVLGGWQEESEWTVNDKVWADVTFDNLFTTVVPDTETESVLEPTEQ